MKKIACGIWMLTILALVAGCAGVPKTEFEALKGRVAAAEGDARRQQEEIAGLQDKASDLEAQDAKLRDETKRLEEWPMYLEAKVENNAVAINDLRKKQQQIREGVTENLLLHESWVRQVWDSNLNVLQMRYDQERIILETLGELIRIMTESVPKKEPTAPPEVEEQAEPASG